MKKTFFVLFVIFMSFTYVNAELSLGGSENHLQNTNIAGIRLGDTIDSIKELLHGNENLQLLENFQGVKTLIIDGSKFIDNKPDISLVVLLTEENLGSMVYSIELSTSPENFMSNQALKEFLNIKAGQKTDFWAISQGEIILTCSISKKENDAQIKLTDYEMEAKNMAELNKKAELAQARGVDIF